MKVCRSLVLGAVLLVLAGTDVQAQSREPLGLFRFLKDMMLGLVGRSASEPGYLQNAARINHLQKRMTDSFPCVLNDPDNPPRSKVKPSSVHELRPGDIDVIGAMGDSLTAGSGAAASNILQVSTENRGISWSIGGQGTWREYLTLPNILKEFNPALFGYSLSDSFTHHRASQFNVAEVGAMSRDLPYMAKQLVNRMARDPRVNLEDDWKLITLMIGANDFCADVCYMDDPRKAPEKHRRDIIQAIATVRDNLPRTIVVVVPAPDVEILVNFTGKPPICRISHMFECPCYFGAAHQGRVKEYRGLSKEWQLIDKEIQDLPEFNGRPDFAVVFQPFVMELVFPTKRGVTDYSMLSSDCFHFSQKGYARASNALWNNIMDPVGQKAQNWEPAFKIFRCPSKEFPYIFTNKNSNTKVSQSRSASTDFVESNLLKRSIDIKGR